jgi:hypothetical protein
MNVQELVARGTEMMQEHGRASRVAALLIEQHWQTLPERDKAQLATDGLAHLITNKLALEALTPQEPA